MKKIINKIINFWTKYTTEDKNWYTDKQKHKLEAWKQNRFMTMTDYYEEY